MRKIILVAMVLAMITAPVLGFTVTKWKTKTLSVAGDVTFTSSITAADGGETITIEIQPVDTAVDITSVDFKKATPQPKSPGGSISNVNIAGDGKSATLDVSFEGKKTLHLWVYLSTGEHIGVNVKAG